MSLLAEASLVPASANTALSDFETTPGLAQEPSIFVAVPGPQTIVTPPAAYSRGAVLGFVTFFSAIAFVIAPNLNKGCGLVDVIAAGGITSVTIAPTSTPSSAWDFLINSLAFNQNITSIINPPPPRPPPWRD
jgi:hypothetical protein